MQSGVVQDPRPTQKGDKCWITINGQKYLGDISLQNHQGAVVEFEKSSFQGKEGEWINTIKSYSVSQEKPPSVAVGMTSVDASHLPPDVMRFVSNVVGQAISHGVIANPQQIIDWAVEARRVGLSIYTGQHQPPSLKSPSEPSNW